MQQLKEINLLNYDRRYTLALFARLCCICHAIRTIGDIPLKRHDVPLSTKEDEDESIDTINCRIYYERTATEDELI